MKKRIFSQIVSIIITLTMLLQICPLGVLASGIFSAAEEKDILPSDALNELDSDPVLEEDVSKRNEFSKHYVTPDGRRYAVIYSDQIHYEEDGEWKEVDNTFTLSEGVYQSNNEIFKTQFAEKANDNSLVSIEEGEYKLSWSLSFDKGLSLKGGNIKDAELTISKVNAKVHAASDENEVKTLSNISNEGKSVSALSYNNIFTENVDVNYSVYHGKVKEDVILKSADAIKSYTMIVNAEGLYAVKNDDNTVPFVNREGECIFTLGAPWMMDAKGDVSDEISVMLFSKDGKTLVTYTPSEEWLNSDEREYPVVIDPSFTSRNYTSNYEDTYVHQNDGANSTRPTETMLLIGNRYGEDYYAYIKIKKLIDIDEAYYVNSASFNFRMNTTAKPVLSVYSADEEWDADTITYDTQPQTTLISSANNGSVVNSYSKYSIDLTSWMSEKRMEYGRISDFFKSSEWNGFKIGYTTITSNYHTPIYSSEYTTASYRPTMVIEYSYEPYGGIKDGAVYSFKNVGSGKYITASASAYNVYQYAKNNTSTQAFRLEYDSATEGFRIKTVTDNNGIGNTKCISFAYNSLIGSSETAEVNVQLTSYSASRPENQDWIFAIDSDSGYYKIVSAYEPNCALTVRDDHNGSSSTSSVDATGNVYLSAFHGSVGQLWEIESGGSNVNAIVDIREADENNEEFILYENEDWMSFYCTVDNFGDNVSWESTNTVVAEVGSNGVVSTNKAGYTVINATVTHTDGSEDVYSVNVYVVIKEGVYYMKSAANNYRIQYADPNALYDNAYLEANSRSTLPTSNERYAMFKIKYIGNDNYIIRSMLDSRKAWTEQGNGIVMSDIGTSDSGVNTLSTWKIKADDMGYCIYRHVNSKVLIYDSAYETNIRLGIYDSSPGAAIQRWEINEIAASYNGVTLKESTDALAVGNTFDFDAVMYSSYDDVNGQNGIVWSVTNGTGSATINSQTGVLTGVSVGTVTVTAKYIQSSNTVWSTSCNVEVYRPAVMLIHGRKDNSFTLWGAETRVYVDPSDTDDKDNNHFDSSINATTLGGLVYTDVATQEIIDVFNGPNDEAHSQGGNLAYYLVQQGYTVNEDLFVFNYPNQDAVIHSANKFDVYLQNLANDIRLNGTTKAKASFFGKVNGITPNSNYCIDIVAHSMGGLVARYYIENIGKDENIRRLITIDTPHWGSGLADASNATSVQHMLCDHDLAKTSSMYGGVDDLDLDCDLLINKCYTGNYLLTDELNYDTERTTEYYAIAGLNSPIVYRGNDNFGFEIDTQYDSFSDIEAQVVSKYLSKGYVLQTSWYSPESGDNIVGLLSQIGCNDILPLKKIDFEKIYIYVDVNGGNYILDHLHGKVPHRMLVIEQVLDYLTN